MALSNAFRYNYSDLNGCSLLIDIGARTTNLVFVEDKRVFSRSIPVGGSTISSSISKEFKEEITVGEKLKLEKGLVGLGGNYAEPDDPTEARISKIVRGTMTRLHAEVARSVSFYRQNQSGGAPVRAYLSGGTVGLPYMVEFFSEKLLMPVELFNSLRNVTVGKQNIATKSRTRLAHWAKQSAARCGPLGMCRWKSTSVRIASLASRISPDANRFLSSRQVALFFVRRRGVSTSTGPTRSPGRCSMRQPGGGKLETVAKQFDALDSETKRLQAAAGPFILAVNERFRGRKFSRNWAPDCHLVSSG